MQTIYGPDNENIADSDNKDGRKQQVESLKEFGSPAGGLLEIR